MLLLLLIFSLLVLYRFYYFNSFRFVSFFLLLRMMDGWMEKERKTKLEVDWLKKSSPRTLQKKKENKEWNFNYSKRKKVRKIKIFTTRMEEWKVPTIQYLYDLTRSSLSLQMLIFLSFPLLLLLLSLSFLLFFLQSNFFSEG